MLKDFKHRGSLFLVLCLFLVLGTSCDRTVTLLNCPSGQSSVGSYCLPDDLALFFQKFFGSSNFNFLNTPPPIPLVLDGPSHQSIEEDDFIYSNNYMLGEINFAIIFPFFQGNYNYCQVEALSRLANGVKTRFQYTYYSGQPDSGIIEVDGRSVSWWYQNGETSNTLEIYQTIDSTLEFLRVIYYNYGYDSHDNYTLIPFDYLNVDFRKKEAVFQSRSSMFFHQPYASKMSIKSKSQIDIITNIDFSLSAELLLIPRDYRLKEPFFLSQGVFKMGEEVVYFNRNEDFEQGPGSPNNYVLPSETIQYSQSLMDQLPPSRTEDKTVINSNFTHRVMDEPLNDLFQQYFFNCMYDLPFDTPMEENNDDIKLDEEHK